MEQNQFYKQLVERYTKNQASVQEMEVLFHLVKTGEIDEVLLNSLSEEADKADEVVLLRRRRFPLFRIAAAVLLVAGISMLLYSKKDKIRDVVDPVHYVNVEVPSGRVRKLILADGTRVWLNAGSRLRYPEKFNRDTRLLYLSGEAYFDVFHDAEKPFIIKSDRLNTIVLGTSFNVKAYKNEPATVTVRSGRVSVAERSDLKTTSIKETQRTVTLGPAQQATYLGEKGFGIRHGVASEEYAGWQNGDLVFTGRTLLEMKPILERWYGVTIHLENQKLTSCSMVGSYHQETLKNVLEAMRFALNITYKIDGKNVMIRGGKCR